MARHRKREERREGQRRSALEKELRTRESFAGVNVANTPRQQAEDRRTRGAERDVTAEVSTARFPEHDSRDDEGAER